MTTPPGNDRFDVIIAGGGFVGATLALALAGLPLRVAVIEPRPPGAGPGPAEAGEGAHVGASPDPRCTALAAGSVRILEGLDLWPSFAGGATPIRRIHVSERGRFGATEIDAEREGVEALGYVVENAPLSRSLWALLTARAAGGRGSGGVARGSDAVDTVGLECLAPAEVVAAQCRDEAASVHVRTAAGVTRVLQGSLLVVADGARSPLRGMLGIGAEVHSYRQRAITATVTPERLHEHVAYERFTASGPLALLPMASGRMNLVWTVWNDDAAECLALSDRAFLRALQTAFGYRLGRFVDTTARLAWPLHLSASAPVAPPRCALLGNAAIGVHPVAGQGLNLGLRDVASLAELIADAMLAGECDVGRPALLQTLADWRRADRRRVVNFTDGLVRLFTQPGAALGVARGAGLAALDLLPLARSALARQAMGLSGRVPRLARGLPLLREAERDRLARGAAGKATGDVAQQPAADTGTGVA